MSDETKQQMTAVDAALALNDKMTISPKMGLSEALRYMALLGCKGHDTAPSAAMRILAAEVRRLREENTRLRNALCVGGP